MRKGAVCSILMPKIGWGEGTEARHVIVAKHFGSNRGCCHLWNVLIGFDQRAIAADGKAIGYRREVGQSVAAIDDNLEGIPRKILRRRPLRRVRTQATKQLRYGLLHREQGGAADVCLFDGAYPLHGKA